MFVLVFTVDEKKYGIDVENIVSVAPAFDIMEDTSHSLPFVGWREYQEKRIPVFDLNYAINDVLVKYLFGTRHIIVNCQFGEKKIRIALVAQGLESVSEFASESISGNVGDVFRVAKNNEYENLMIVNIPTILKEALFDYE
jgi:chemotaxis signal transduction protein